MKEIIIFEDITDPRIIDKLNVYLIPGFKVDWVRWENGQHLCQVYYSDFNILIDYRWFKDPDLSLIPHWFRKHNMEHYVRLHHRGE